MNEAKRILDPERGATTNSAAKRILAWLQKRKFDKVALRYVQQYGPVQVREKTKLAKAIDLLIENNHVQKTKLEGTIFISKSKKFNHINYATHATNNLHKIRAKNPDILLDS